MSSALRPSPGLTPEEGAAWWIARADGPLSTEDQAALDAWLAENEANSVAYERANIHWGLFEGGDDHPQLNALLDAALVDKPKPTLRWLKWPGIAASIAACLIAGIFVSPLRNDFAEIGSRHSVSPMATLKGESRVITLADGSIVTLNTDTEISPVFTVGRRTVRLLRGQALFKVKHDASRPFVVEAAGRQVTALGTLFEVRLDPGRVQVTLVEGRVAVDTADSVRSESSAAPVVLKPGQEYVVEMGMPQQVMHVDTGVQLRWREGFVEFDNLPLKEAVAEMNRYSDRLLVVEDDRIGALRVSGVFKTSNPERFAANMSDLLPVVARTAGADRIVLAARNEVSAN